MLFDNQQRREVAKMIMNVHDELVFEVEKPYLSDIIDITRIAMEHSFSLLVPLLVEFVIFLLHPFTHSIYLLLLLYY